MPSSKGRVLSPPRAARFSSRSRSSTSGRCARIWKSHVVALLDASCDAKRNVNIVWPISSSLNSRIRLIGFSASVSPAAIFSLYALDSIMCATHWSTMHMGSAPDAMLALHAAAHLVNSSSTASAMRFPRQHFVKGIYMEKGTLTSSNAAVTR